MARINVLDEPVKLDIYDQKIINNLKNNSRLSYAQLGKKVRLASDTTRYRVKKLLDLGIIDKFTLELDIKLFGYDQYYILFQLVDSGAELTKQFIKKLEDNEKITRIISYTDKWDFLCVLQCKGVEELDEELNDINGDFGSIILDQEIMELVRDYSVPKTVITENVFDEINIKIINELFNNSRISIVELAQKIGLSADAIIYRMKKFKGMNFTTITNINKQGMYHYNILAMMTHFSQKEEAKLKTYMQTNLQFTGAVKIIGKWNVILSLEVKNIQEFHAGVKNFRTVFAESLKDIDTLQSFQEIKNKSFI